MIKIPQIWGLKTINLTMEYIQEEVEDPAQNFEEKKKCNNSYLLVSDLFPIHKDMQMVGHELACIY